MKKAEIRCNEARVSKGGQRVRCGAFLAEVSVDEIRVRCRRCGTIHVVTRDAVGGLRVKSLPKGQALISGDKDGDC